MASVQNQPTKYAELLEIRNHITLEKKGSKRFGKSEAGLFMCFATVKKRAFHYSNENAGSLILHTELC